MNEQPYYCVTTVEHSTTHVVLVILGVMLGLLHTVALIVFLYYAYVVANGLANLGQLIGH